jgi:hypothetical protein
MASGNSPEKLGRSGVAGGHCILVRTESLRAPIGTTQGRPAHDQWAKLRLIRDTISHYSPVLIAPLSNPISSRQRREKKERIAGEGLAQPDGALARGLLRPRHSESLPGRGSILNVARGQFRMSLDMARKAAATLQAIGDVVGLTREWVRQISIDQCGGIIRSRPTSQVASRSPCAETC